MPVILRNDSLEQWLDPAISFNHLQDKLINEETYEGARDGFRDDLKLESIALAPYVNLSTSSGPKCLQSLVDYNQESFSKGIGRFFPKQPKQKLN